MYTLTMGGQTDRPFMSSLYTMQYPYACKNCFISFSSNGTNTQCSLGGARGRRAGWRRFSEVVLRSFGWVMIVDVYVYIYMYVYSHTEEVVHCARGRWHAYAQARQQHGQKWSLQHKEKEQQQMRWSRRGVFKRYPPQAAQDFSAQFQGGMYEAPHRAVVFVR